jgi:hypothetical protein
MPENNDITDTNNGAQCDNCGENHLNDNSLIEDVNGDMICQNCGIACEDCRGVHANTSEHIHYVDGSFRCDNCSMVCADCSERGISYDHENHAGDAICDSCSDDYDVCEDCCEVIPNGNTHRFNDSTLCECCYEAAVERDEEENGGSSNGTINDYCYRPTPIFFNGHKCKNGRRRGAAYFGIEVECEDRDGDVDLDDCAENITSDLYYCKSDGSLNNGFEVVSHPASMAYWREDGCKAFKQVADAGMRSYGVSTCGMHIHISKDSISKCDQFKLLQFFKYNAPFIVKLSRRRSKVALDRWAAVEHGTNKVFIEKVKGGLGAREAQRYLALNFRPRKTIECRIFRGTLSPDAILRNIEALNAIIEFCKDTGFGSLTFANLMLYLHGKGKKKIGSKAAKMLSDWFVSMDIKIGEIEQCA